MLIFYAKYTLLMCAFINIKNNRKCENQLNEASTGRETYLHAACTAKCLLHDKNRNFEECNDYCIHSKEARKINAVGTLKKINESHNLILICRDDRSLSLKVVVPPQVLQANETIAMRANISRPLPHHRQPPTRTNHNSSLQEVYVVNLSVAVDPEDVYIYLSNDQFITIDNLRPNTTYNVSLAVVYSSNEYSIIAKGEQFTTLRRGYKPKEVLNISVLQFAADETDEMRVSALISWIPSKDMTCHYDFIYYSPKREDMEVTPIEIRNPQLLYTYAMDNLTFATAYSVGIRAKNTHDSSKESELVWRSIETPSCMEWHNNNFNICAPFKPEGLTIDEHFLAANEFSLNVSWIHPKFEPDYYTLRILDLDQLHTYDVKSYIVNVTKERNWVFIPILTLKGMVYEAHLTAYTPGGNSTSVVRLPNKIRIQVSDTNQVLKLIIAILAPIFCIAILSLTTFIICHRRAKLKRYQERCKYFEELEKKAPIDPKSTFHFPTKALAVPSSQDDLHQIQLDLEEKLFFNDEMEINRSDLTLFEILGEGAFGLVRRGVYRESKQNGKTDDRDVAVKMLKDHPSVEDVRAFRREIEVMKSVGSHPNIVGIIGHCTRKYNEMLLLTEYCSLGNLQYFLRNEWKYLHELSSRTANNPSIPAESTGHIGRPLSAKAHRKLSESVFNFDSTMVEKIKLKYKNIYSTSSNGSTGYVGSLGGVTQYNSGVVGKDEPTKPPPTNGRQQPMQYGEYNESYGHYEICTSACKCQVEIIGRDAVTDSNRKNTPKCRQIKISNKCDCRLRRSKLLSIDNESYYKNLFTTAPKENAKKMSDQGVLIAKREPLKSTDLMDIAKQVAMGMEFLSKNKVVHRDLAARNILVSSDRTVKIADFGLSRDVYQENVYKKTGNGKLPIRWLALESMTHQVYTSQSDVWSYGILLYEIATLGGIPYPSIPTNRLLHLLKSGYRMERPKNCGPQFYSLMLSCWNSNPSERPSFTEIIKILDCLLNEAPQLQVEQLMTPKLKQSPEAVTSDDSYLKPL